MSALADALQDEGMESAVFILLSGISIGDSVESPYGSIQRVSDTEFTITIKEEITIDRPDGYDDDCDKSIRDLFD